MNEIKVGDKYKIHIYKHNGKIDSCCDEVVVLDVSDECIVLGNDRALLIESDGHSRKTREPAIIYFFKNHWYNIIAQLKQGGIYYYCNLATPFIIEENVIKYIDYDLDLRVFPNGAFKILDKLEYLYHKKLMNYSNDIDSILKKELTNLINRVRNKSIPFSEDFVNYYYTIYKQLVGIDS